MALGDTTVGSTPCSTDLTKNQHKRWNTLSRRLAAISELHQQAGFDSPTRSWAVEQFLAGLRRELGIAPARKKPVLVADLKLILQQIPNSLLGVRDRALLLLGFSGAFRRSELVGLDVEDLEETRDGLVSRSVGARPIRKGREERSACRRAPSSPVAPCGRSSNGAPRPNSTSDRCFVV